MKFRLVVVGRARDGMIGAASADYEARVRHYWPLMVHEVREERGSDAALVRRREGERLLEATTGALLIACDATGVACDSTDFAERMQRWREGGRDVAFAIGGAFGLDAAVLDAAALRLQLARWTLPHELARLVLAEQLYRAGTILKREPYHK